MIEGPRHRARAWGAILALVGLAACTGQASERPRQDVDRAFAQSDFGRLIERLSEPGGYFDTDNLISNETSYLHVMGALERLGAEGGAYLGVGPDQNFSYIARIRPTVAFVIDIRRDNLLQQFWFKALFEEAAGRVEYLSMLLGRPAPNSRGAWREWSIEELVGYFDDVPADPSLVDANRAAIESRIQGFGYPLSDSDLATIRRFHREFIDAGLGLRFHSLGRAPQPYYPTYRDLLLATDLAGDHANYLAREADFRFVKALEERDRIVPVVGDLAGPHAVQAVGEYLREVGEPVSAFYTSNVEFYVMRAGTFDRFAENVMSLPRNDRSVIIRSFFGGRFRFRHPQAVPGHFSVQLLQTLDSFAEEARGSGFATYFELVTKHAIPLR